MQEVQLDTKIKLLDSPGIVFASGSDSNASLRNAISISKLSDPITPANAILQRVNKQQMMEMYDITNYNTPDVSIFIFLIISCKKFKTYFFLQEFYSLKAARMGKFKKGGIPNVEAAARSILDDWNRYFTIKYPFRVSESHF